MEKGFNDKELADIMSEIESLEREFATDSAAHSAKQPPAEEVEEENEVLQELAEAPIEKSVPQKVVAMKPARPSAAAPSSLHFKVEGEMKISLSFEVNGQKVSLEVTGDDLCIETDSGAKFSLPMHPAQARKAS